MDDKKKLYMIIIAFFGVILVFFVIFILSKNVLKDNDSNYNKYGNETAGKVDQIVKISSFDINNFEVKKNTPNQVNMVFKLTNTSKNDIVGKSLDINMYDGKVLLHTYGYIIESLKTSEYIYIQANASFKYNKIDKFEFVIDDEKVSISPNYID